MGKSGKRVNFLGVDRIKEISDNEIDYSDSSKPFKTVAPSRKNGQIVRKTFSKFVKNVRS